MIYIYIYIYIQVPACCNNSCFSKNILLKGIKIFKKVKCILTFLNICVYI